MLLDEARQVLEIEADGIMKLIGRLDHRFEQMVDTIMHAHGRLIISGIGKSGIIGRKIAATLNSTGTRALFLHPVEAMHGDLGIVCPDDVFLAMSYSGETGELNLLMPSIRKLGCPVIAMTGNPESTLAKYSDIVIDVGVEKEACPLGLAPTASTTALLAMGDALAVVLINKKHFKSSDFKRFHPGGALGQRLSREVSDIMLSGKSIPITTTRATMREAVAEMDLHGLGAIIIVEPAGKLAGIFTDGDLRRMIARGDSIFDQSLPEVMTPAPLNASAHTPAFDALNIMEQHEITILPIIDQSRRVIGILHLHDILGKGEFKFNGTAPEKKERLE
ncbi:carbohydrate isomerase KpsF/GutQ family protein [Desulfosarcina ovata subsp. sediminis]|uniref:Carbohydrate isomerase KpsF/GutQ family protein n=1 Tax=Desulfosarcina ovata subsp. sediminis TaxID=885957 RepID=A0A5K7ZIB2_9BACT|nr:KpsF/GutQ family sugar-phosphate isomerase [Desulfosarcina ovata]BBO80611.1 carbohydrate isomerase KpsF/GutQ family protein [Desulfosarcina ovata subsp. sediminis]